MCLVFFIYELESLPGLKRSGRHLEIGGSIQAKQPTHYITIFFTVFFSNKARKKIAQQLFLLLDHV
jgi:hypothetical protein